MDCVTRAYSARLQRVSSASTSSFKGSTWPSKTRSLPRPLIVLAHTVPLGKTSKNVASSLFTVAKSLSYSGTHWVTMPPGLKCCLTSSKYCFEYSDDVPLTHG